MCVGISVWFRYLLACLLTAFPMSQWGKAYATVSNCPPVGSHIPSSGRLCMPARSVCFWTPWLSLGHPGSFTSVHDLKCMRTQTAPLFNAPRGRRGNRAQVPFPRIHPVTWTGVEPTTLGLWVRRAIHSATAALSKLSKTRDITL